MFGGRNEFISIISACMINNNSKSPECQMTAIRPSNDTKGLPNMTQSVPLLLSPDTFSTAVSSVLLFYDLK